MYVTAVKRHKTPTRYGTRYRIAAPFLGQNYLEIAWNTFSSSVGRGKEFGSVEKKVGSKFSFGSKLLENSMGYFFQYCRKG